MTTTLQELKDDARLLVAAIHTVADAYTDPLDRDAFVRVLQYAVTNGTFHDGKPARVQVRRALRTKLAEGSVPRLLFPIVWRAMFHPTGVTALARYRRALNSRKVKIMPNIPGLEYPPGRLARMAANAKTVEDAAAIEKLCRDHTDAAKHLQSAYAEDRAVVLQAIYALTAKDGRPSWDAVGDALDPPISNTAAHRASRTAKTTSVHRTSEMRTQRRASRRNDPETQRQRKAERLRAQLAELEATAQEPAA